jgi:hypothetical protein
MKVPLAAVAILVLLLCGGTHAASLLSEQQARAKVIEILKGDPYGTTATQVAANIKQAQLIKDGYSRACREPKKMLWEFHVVTTTAEQHIDGYLAVDARSGKLVCTNLPLLD